MTGILLMIGGGLMLLAGVLTYSISKNEIPLVPQENTVTKKEQSEHEKNKKKGDDFEAFIVSKFNRENFIFKNWAGDKYSKGQYAESTTQPDLLYEWKGSTKDFPIWVECKWRSKAENGKLKFAYPKQFERYKIYEKEEGIPVFIALGVGGKPNKPEHLFVIPLRFIHSHELDLSKLEGYRKSVDDEFVYNAKDKFINSKNFVKTKKEVKND